MLFKKNVIQKSHSKMLLLGTKKTPSEKSSKKCYSLNDVKKKCYLKKNVIKKKCYSILYKLFFIFEKNFPKFKNFISKKNYQ